LLEGKRERERERERESERKREHNCATWNGMVLGAANMTAHTSLKRVVLLEFVVTAEQFLAALSSGR